MFKEEYLCHYGVQGMKWGVRKSVKKYTNRVKTRAKAIKNKTIKPMSEDAKQFKDIKKKGINQMSNEELKTATKRMRLVNDFQQEASRSVLNGKHWASATLIKTGNTYVSFLTDPKQILSKNGKNNNNNNNKS